MYVKIEIFLKISCIEILKVNDFILKKKHVVFKLSDFFIYEKVLWLFI